MNNRANNFFKKILLLGLVIFNGFNSLTQTEGSCGEIEYLASKHSGGLGGSLTTQQRITFNDGSNFIIHSEQDIFSGDVRYSKDRRTWFDSKCDVILNYFYSNVNNRKNSTSKKYRIIKVNMNKDGVWGGWIKCDGEVLWSTETGRIDVRSCVHKSAVTFKVITYLGKEETGKDETRKWSGTDYEGNSCTYRLRHTFDGGNDQIYFRWNAMLLVYEVVLY
jgi:hypothetical protein